MKKIFLTTTLVASTALLAFAVPAQADEIDNAQTDVGVSFDTDGPNKPEPGPFKDNLALVWTPTRFNFGKQEAVANIATYNNMVEGDQYIVVNDDRELVDSKTSAWKVSATLSDLVSTDSAATTLPAKLTFTLDDPEAYDIGLVDPDTNDYLPNPIEGNLSVLSGTHNIVTGSAVTLEAGNTTAATILGKTTENGVVGGFATKLSNTKLTVTSSAGAAGKTFKGTVTWSLDDTY